MGRGAKPGKAKGKGKRPVVRGARKSNGSRIHDFEKRLAEAQKREEEAQKREVEALEQQTATAEVLKVISRSTFDLQPVLDTLIENAARLCNARRGVIVRRDGDVYRGVAFYNASPDLVEFVKRHPVTPGRQTITARVALERQTIHVPDLQADPEYSYALRDVDPIRTELGVPMLRGEDILGVIILYKLEVQPFTDKQIALLQTFADQAVIAIENVRLFTELQDKNHALTEALEQQTATSEILRVISSSPTDTQPVFDTIAANAARLCAARDAQVLRVDGDVLRLVSAYGSPSMAPMRSISRGHAVGRAVIDRQTVHVRDMAQAVMEFPETSAPQHGVESLLAVPLLRNDVAVGVIRISRTQIQPFTDAQIALLQTFADQAVIAIENVRLFTELQASNRELTTALDTQTATSDILRVISRSQTDVQPVFDAIVVSAVRLLGAYTGALTRLADGQIELAALTSVDDAGDAAVRATFPHSIQSEGPYAQVMLDRAPLNVADAQTDPRWPEAARARARVRGYRSWAAVPLLRHDEGVGAISVARREPGGFADDEIALLKTFADQAVIAIENARLFKELQEKNRALTEAHGQVTEALEQQTATSEILGVISSSPTHVEPVFQTILSRTNRLCEASFSVLWLWDGEALIPAAHANVSPELAERLRTSRAHPRRGGSPVALTALEQTVIHVPDVLDDPRFSSADVPSYQLGGARSILSVPMLREGGLVGVINTWRREPRAFTDKQVELLKTFADQAVIAIENVRLFKELEARNRDLTATGEILQVISRSPTDVQPVFNTIVRSAGHLCEATFSAVVLVDGDELTLVAAHGEEGEAMVVLRNTFPRPLGRDTATGRAVIERRAVHIPDVQADQEYHSRLRAGLGTRTMLAVPMLREGAPIGAIGVWRHEVRPFTDNQLALLQTFADQAVIAIENVRLFKELQTRTAELTRSVGELTALGEVSQALSSTLDIETVLDTIVSRASQLVGDAGCSIYEYDEATEHFELRATHHYDVDFVEALRAAPLRKGEGLMGRATKMREPIQIPDITQPGAYQSSVRDTLIRFGYRALLSVPLVREDQIIGSLSFNRKTPGEFPPEIVDVLRTFATQSALAIQNARLFREIEDKSRQLEAASRHKSEFLANMSHELRTPLNAVIGFSEVLIQRMFGALNDKQDEYLKDIYASGQHLLSLINDILDLSKIEAGRMELEPADFDLPSAIDNALILVRERATRRGITLGRHLDEGLGTIRGDERKVKQVLLNLLSNALKFTPEGGRIDVRAALHGGVAEVSVADTGVGIAPEDQAAVFEEFRQVGTADRKVEGTGLGLALSQKFVELHGGRIWVDSELGRGSTFTFTLPVS